MVTYFAPLTESDKIQQRLDEAQKRFSDGKKDEESGIFIAELLERYDLEAIDLSIRQSSAPAIWRYRRPWSLQDFRMELSLVAGNEQKFPLLSAFLMSEPQLRALRHLPQVIDWQSLLTTRYNRVLDYQTSSRTTVKEALDSAPDKRRWLRAWLGYSEAWNDTWKTIERFECQRIPAIYREVVQDEKTPLSFSLPYEKDEGVCPLTLLRALGARHNQFIERLNEALLLRGREHVATARESNVSSKFFSTSHAINYDLQGAIEPFLEKQCVQYSSNGNVLYDFRKAEQYLLDVVFSGKPVIDLEIRMMQYTNTQQEGTYLLKQKVRQEPLSKETEEKILKELGSPSVARACLELLETCISFLQATGGSFVQKLEVGEKKLGEYVKTVLLMEEAEFSSNTISQTVRLKHVDALWKLLRDYTVVDPFASVQARYREPIDEKMREVVTASVEHLDLKQMMPLMKEFMQTQCGENCQMNHEESLKVCMSFLGVSDGELTLGDLPWFSKFFPEQVKMRNLLDTYNVFVAAWTS